MTCEADGRLGSVLKEKYRLESVLGIGGMAVVYAATHRNQKRFAVKILHTELSVRADIRSRFVREGYIANTVGHPGAVAVLDDDVASDGAAFLVMELLDGAALDHLWDRHGSRVPLRAALAAGWQLLDVLAAAHAKSIVHRDIKPANLFITRDGTLKVLDFGIARLRDVASEHATQSGTSMGTPAFMPPEQVMGRSSQIDALTDIWAVGATLFTLVSGELVHDGESPQELMIKSATTPARSVASVMPDLPREVIALIDRALEFDRAKRWPDATTMRDAITAAHQAAFRESISSTALSSLVAAGDEAAARTALGAVPSSATPGSVAATVDARGIPETLDATAIARTVPAAPVTKLLGMTTSQPVSTEMPRAATPAVPHSGPKPGRRVGVIVAVAGLLIASASTVGLVVSRRKPPEGSLAPARASEDSALPAFGATGATATIGQPLAPSAVRPDAADVVSIPPTVTPPGGGAPAVATAARTSRGPIAPARSAIPLATTSASPVAPAPPPAPPSRPSCDPPFTIDAAGHRRPKPECI